MNKFNRLFNIIMEDTKSSKIKAKKLIKEDYDDQDEDEDDYDDYDDAIRKDNYKDELKSGINNAFLVDPSKKCNAIIDSLTFDEAKEFLKYVHCDCKYGFEDMYWDQLDVKSIMNKYSSWCEQWKKDNQKNVDYYKKWASGQVEDDEDQPEEMDYGWVTDDAILRGKYASKYMIGDALNQGIITDKFDALALYAYLQMYWNSIDEPDYDDGIAACGIDLD